MPPRAVLDTNVLVSALLFSRGNLAWCREAWQAKRFIPLVDHDTASELIRVLAYPKFKLSSSEREELLADFLPYAEVVAGRAPVMDSPELRDADDLKFVALAVTAGADVLMSGDGDILELKETAISVPVFALSRFRKWLADETHA